MATVRLTRNILALCCRNSSSKLDGHQSALIGLCTTTRHFTLTATQFQLPKLKQSPDFKFSLGYPGSPMSMDDREFYEENGYLIVKNLYSPEELTMYLQRFKDICEGKVKRSKGMFIMQDVAIAKSEFVNGQRAVTKLQEFQNDEVLFQYCQHKKMLEYVCTVIGENVAAMHTTLINKPSDPGTKSSRHPLHQDLAYFPFRPANRVVTSWTAMEHIHRKNGCLVVVPGSHKEQKVRVHKKPEWEGGVNRFYQGIEDYDPNQKLTYLEMDAGDTLFFHPLLVHGSGANNTDGFRKALCCHYASSDCYILDDKDLENQQLIQEINDVSYFKKMGIVNATYGESWSLKAKIVHGKRVNIGY